MNSGWGLVIFAPSIRSMGTRPNSQTPSKAFHYIALFLCFWKITVLRLTNKSKMYFLRKIVKSFRNAFSKCSLTHKPAWWIARASRFICGLLVGLGKLNFNDRSKYFTFKTATNSSFINPVPIKCWPWKSYHILLWPGRELSKISENGIKCHHASASLNPFNVKRACFLDFSTWIYLFS